MDFYSFVPPFVGEYKMSLQSYIYCDGCQENDVYYITIKTGNKNTDGLIVILNEVYVIENSVFRGKENWNLDEFKFNVDNKHEFFVIIV